MLDVSVYMCTYIYIYYVCIVISLAKMLRLVWKP